MAIKLSNRIKLVKPSPTLVISARAKEMMAEGIDVVNFGVGEPDFDTPDYIKKSAAAALDANFTRYTANAGIIELRKAICARFERENGLHYQPNQVLVSAGAKASIYMILMAVCDAMDQVLIPAPYWVSYPYQAILAGAEPVILPTLEQDQYKLRPDALRQACEENACAKVLLLNSPSNPTGTVYTEQELRELARIVIEKNLLVISDEIYERLVYDGIKHVSIANVLPEMIDHTIVINGVSKAYAMTGWRLGYAAGPAHIISAAGRVQAHSTSNVNSITQKASVTALDEEDDSIENMRQEFELRRDFICNELAKIPHISFFRPKGAFYVLPDISWYLENNRQGIKTSDEFCNIMLEKHHVALVSGGSFGIETALRFSYANSMDNLKKGLQRFADFLAELRS